ncbi:hypothetical protein LZ198_07000 [Myxococcus sp. K15C18031901]|uniref:hypothetical protein n=1 Tax=Myxococcus dinghuensis TaxID=2906761 RepID=UPI0020A7772D|nr:hypothetical protein [Myxococcus dinghuensis]MCP3098622.1 hypothetical protein [Myxococcus dinghuensis]
MTPRVPTPPHLTAPRFVQALRSLEPRSAALLNRRLVAGHLPGDCAAFYGVSSEAFSVQLLRAVVLLARQVESPQREPEGRDEEEAWARMLTTALEREGSPVPTGLVPGVELCRRLQAQSEEVARGLEAAAQEDLASPQRRREEWLRRLAITALLALTAYLYLSRPGEPSRRPPPAPEPPAATPDRH